MAIKINSKQLYIWLIQIYYGNFLKFFKVGLKRIKDRLNFYKGKKVYEVKKIGSDKWDSR